MRRLATILIKPRETMREILDSLPDRMVWRLVLLAILSGFLSNFDRAKFQQDNAPMNVAVVIGFLALSCVVMIGMFYALSWVAYLVARRFFEGTGTWAETRSAFAWGLVPAIWALLYRLPAAFLVARERQGVVVKGSSLTFDHGVFDRGCITIIILGFLEIAVFIGLIVLESHTLGEAHRFSSWRGLATFLMTCAAPFVVLISAVLAMS